MQTFVIANPKGGSGKSTVSTTLAGALARRGYRVMLGDIDRQQSARQWLRLRPPDCAPIAGWEIAPDNIARAPAGTTHAILDTPAGLHGKLLDRVLKLNCRILVPVQPSLFDILATQQFLADLRAEKAIQKGRCDIAIIGMRVDARTHAARELERFFADLEIPVLGHLRDTQNYVRCAAAGVTVFDLAPSRVSIDLEQWRPIMAWADPVAGL
jgi:chromosome partitioning protein